MHDKPIAVHLHEFIAVSDELLYVRMTIVPPRRIQPYTVNVEIDLPSRIIRLKGALSPAQQQHYVDWIGTIASRLTEHTEEIDDLIKQGRHKSFTVYPPE